MNSKYIILASLCLADLAAAMRPQNFNDVQIPVAIPTQSTIENVTFRETHPHFPPTQPSTQQVYDGEQYILFVMTDTPQLSDDLLAQQNCSPNIQTSQEMVNTQSSSTKRGRKKKGQKTKKALTWENLKAKQALTITRWDKNQRIRDWIKQNNLD